MRQFGERQVPEGVHFLGGGRRIRRIDLHIPLPYRLQNGVRVHHVGMGLYPVEILRKRPLVFAALLERMEHKLSGGGICSGIVAARPLPFAARKSRLWAPPSYTAEGGHGFRNRYPLRKLSTYVEGNLGNLLHAVAGPALLDALRELQHGALAHAIAEIIGPGSI